MDTLISAAENRDMFARVAPKYDRMNRLISMGLDVRWRRAAIGALAPAGGGTYLDVGCGTADLCLDILRAQPEAKVTGLDPVEEMLEIGRAKVRQGGTTGSVELIKGDALDLPFEEGRFQGIVSGFCIRNITDRDKAFREMYRVLEQSGRVVILELGLPDSAFLRLLHGIHGRCLVPVAARCAGLSDAYSYLMDSIQAFPGPSAVTDEMRAAGFSCAPVRRLNGGIVNLFAGAKA